MTAIDLTGQRFGRLLVTHRVGSLDGAAQWFCACDCGKSRLAIGSLLRMGHCKSCGCLRSENGRRALTFRYSGPRSDLVTAMRKRLT